MTAEDEREQKGKESVNEMIQYKEREYKETKISQKLFKRR